MAFQDDRKNDLLDPDVELDAAEKAQLLANQICGSLDGCMVILKSFEEAERDDYLSMITSVMDSIVACRQRANNIVNLLDGMPEEF